MSSPLLESPSWTIGWSGGASPELAEPAEGFTTTRVTVVLTTTSASPELAEPAEEGDDDDTDTDDDDDDNDGRLEATRRRRRHGPGDGSKTTPGSGGGGGAKGKAALLAQSLELGWEPDVGAARDDKDNLVGYWRFVEVWSRVEW